MPDQNIVAIVGSGVIGRGWIPVFARHQWQVRVFDPDASQVKRTQTWLAGETPSQAEVVFAASLPEALQGASYVQESVAENLEHKRELFARMDALLPEASLIGSSTSSLDINDIAHGVRFPGRCFTAHPFNPPSVLPVVEVMATRSASATQLEQLCRLLENLGQIPAVMRRFVPGYVGNRLQAAVMREALSLVKQGVVDPNALDAVLAHGLALRWAVLGVFGTNHTNDDAGLGAYYRRFWPSYRSVLQTMQDGAPEVSKEDLETLENAVSQRFARAPVADIAAWRDRTAAALRAVLVRSPFRR